MMTTITKRVDGLVFPESLRWWNEQLWLVDMYDGKVLVFTPQSGLVETVADVPSILGGIARSPEGIVHVVDKSRRRILALKKGGPQVFADLSDMGTSPLNEMIAAPDGSFIVGEYGFQLNVGEHFRKGRIFRVSPDGSVTLLPGEFAFPNGMAVIPETDELVLAESMGRSLSRLPAFGDSPAQRLVRFDQGHPDGIDVDENGLVWCALVGTSEICCINANGRLLERIKLPSQPYDVCVAGASDALLVATSDAKDTDLARNELPRTGAIYEINLDNTTSRPSS